MKKENAKWSGAVIDLLLVGGAALVSLGAGLLNLSAGLIVGGVLAFAGAVLMVKGR